MFEQSAVMDHAKRPHISVVTPVYRGERTVAPLVERIAAALEPITRDLEIVLVNDASPDDSWAQIQAAHAREPRVKGVNLSRNFGQHPAIRAGLDAACGEWVVVMDCDLQDRPEDIPRLYTHAIEGGYDIVLARRANKQFGVLKKLSSTLFYTVLEFLTALPQDHTVGNFGIYRDKAIDAVREMRQSVSFFPIMIQYVGFKQAKLDVEHAEREDGASTYTLKRLIALALDVILASGDKPLKLTVFTGVMVSFVGFCYGTYIFIGALSGLIEVQGWASLMVSLWFLSGVIIAVIGIVGLYIGQIFQQAQAKPFYIIAEVLE
ncbi:MAG: glycosyltransferase family 2 protein [Myxococcota bacterium]